MSARDAAGSGAAGLLAFEARLREAIALDLPPAGPARSVPFRDEREAAVLALWAPHGPAREPALLLTRRTELVETHKGQIALPGGMSDPEDHSVAGAITTALRETREEVGIAESLIRVLGQLPRSSTSTGFLVTPVVGLLEQPAEEVTLSPSEAEIAEVFWAPLSLLLDPATYRLESFEVPGSGLRYQTHVYYVGGHRVWGFTGGLIKSLLDRLAAVTTSG